MNRASLRQKIYTTDTMQELVAWGVPVHCVTIEQGWKEIGTLPGGLSDEVLKAYASYAAEGRSRAMGEATRWC